MTSSPLKILHHWQSRFWTLSKQEKNLHIYFYTLPMNSLARFKYIKYKRITKQDVRHGREKYTEKTERRYKKRNYQRLILIDMWMAYFACLLVLRFSGFAFWEFKEPSELLYPIILYKSDQYCVIVFEEISFLDFSAIVVIFQWTQIQKDWTVWSPIPSTTHINLTKKNVIFFLEPGKIHTHFLVVFINGIRLDWLWTS